MAVGREKIFIYGRHALDEALHWAPQVVQKVYAKSGALNKATFLALKEANISIAPFGKQNGVAKDAVHQGVIGLVNMSKLFVPLNTFLDTVEVSPKSSVVVLDGLTDPHNVGTIIRSAAAFGASAVILGTRAQAPVSGVVVKTSVGMVFRMPLIVVENTVDALLALKKKSFSVYGLAMEGSNDLPATQFDTPVAFVVGNEGKGLSSGVRSQCTGFVRIPMHARTESLNVATSAGAVLYEWSSQHPEALVS